MMSDTTTSEEDTENSILVIGSTGNLSRQVISHLLAAGIEPRNIAALTRGADKESDLKERGIDVREGDYAKPDTLDAAVEGIDKLLLISSSDVGEQRVEHHRNVVEAAKRGKTDRVIADGALYTDSDDLHRLIGHPTTRLADAVAGALSE